MSVLIEPPLTLSAEQLVNIAIERLQADYPDWRPNVASPEYRMMLAFAAIAAEVAALSLDVPEEIIRFVGEVVYRTAIGEAVKATVNSRWTLTASPPAIPAGTVVYVTPEGGSPIGFETKEELKLTSPATEGNVELVAVLPGSEANGCTTASTVVTDEPLAAVVKIVLLETSSGGAEGETFEAYTKRITELARLITPRPILPEDFANYARLQVPDEVISRSTALDEYNPEEVLTFTGTTVSGSNVITEVSNFTGLVPGVGLVGSGIPTPTGSAVTWWSGAATGKVGPACTIVAVNEGAKTIELTEKATANHSKETIKTVGAGNQERCVTVSAVDNGASPSPTVMSDAAKLLEEAREISFKSFVIEPTFNPMEVKCEGISAEGYENAAVESSLKAAIETFLAGEHWGVPQTGDGGTWINRTVLRFQELVTTVNNVPGFDHYTTLEMGLVGGSKGTADINLNGPIPLPLLSHLAVGVT